MVRREERSMTNRRVERESLEGLTSAQAMKERVGPGETATAGLEEGWEGKEDNSE